MDVVITGWVDYSTRCESAESHDEAWEKYQETKKVWSSLPDNPGCEACGYPHVPLGELSRRLEEGRGELCRG